ncbi:MAG: hypothetical protein IJX77_03490 [Ruminococcus sp.]|nr:hypothetical protein [Ruminococcus sp.]
MRLLSNIKNGFKKNLSLAIYSLIAAILAWFVISMTVYPSIPKTIENIPVELDISGTAASENGLSLISCDVSSVDVQIKGNRAEVGNLSSENLKARLVADNVSTTGTKKLGFEIVGTDENIEFEVKSIRPDTATVVFDKYETLEFAVTPEIPNITFAEGKTLDTEGFSCEPEVIQITGPSAQLAKISECAAVSNKEINLLDSSHIVASDEIKLYAEDGSTIDTSAFKFDTPSFNINIPVLTQKTVGLSVGIAGAPSNFNSDFLKFDLSADSITLASKSSQIEFPDKFEIGTISLKDLDIGFTKTFTIDTQDFKNMSNLEAVTVTLDDSNLDRKEFVINDFKVINAPETYDFEVITKSLDIVVVGPEDIIEEITPSDIVANINLLNADKIPESETFNWDITISFPKYDNVWAVTQTNAVVRKTAKTTQTSGSADGDDTVTAKSKAS